MQARVDSKRFGPWALITGASSGIGREFARQIAASHINVNSQLKANRVGWSLHWFTPYFLSRAEWTIGKPIKSGRKCLNTVPLL